MRLLISRKILSNPHCLIFSFALFSLLAPQKVLSQQTATILGNASVEPGATIYLYTAHFPGGTTPEFYTDGYDWNIVTSKNYSLVSFTSTTVEVQWLDGPGEATIYYQAQTYGGDFTASTQVFINTAATVEVYANPATNVGSNSFTANWNSVPGVSGYRIYVGDESFQHPLSGYDGLYVTGTSQVISGLVTGTYYYRVRAVSGAWSSGYSNVVAVEMYTPGIPNALTATAVTASSFIPNWDPVYGATNFLVEVSTNDSFTDIVKSEYQFTKSAVTGLSPGTVYYYRLKARTNPGLESGYSNVVSFLTIPETPVLKIPSNITSTSINVSWTSSKGTDNYWIEVSLGSNFQQLIVNEAVYQTDFTIGNLTPGRQYFYRVRAQNASGSSPYSPFNTTTTMPAIPIAMPATNVNTTTFTANWNVAQGASTYSIDISISPTFSSILKNFTTSSSHLDISELLSSTSYYYRVSVISEGNSNPSYSNVIHTVTLPTVPIATNATNVLENSFMAHWNGTATNGFLLDVSTNSQFTSFVDGYNSLPVNGLQYAVSGLSLKSIYYYRIRAVNAINSPSAYSNTVQVNGVAHNYIRKIDVNVEGKTSIENLANGEAVITHQFYDGLGKLEQTVFEKSSPNFQDIVQPVQYDKLGREALKYLPYVAPTTGWFKSNALKDTESTEVDPEILYKTGDQFKFYQIEGDIDTDVSPYSKKIFEASPISRVMKQGSPGVSWQPIDDEPVSLNDKTIKKRYLLNIENEVCHFKYNEINKTIEVNPSLVFYIPGTLLVDVTYEEKNFISKIYTNSEGQTICKKVQSSKPNEPLAFASTYYIYDDFGNLVLVLPPEGLEKIKSVLNLN